MGLLSENSIRFLDRETESRFLWRFIVSSVPGLVGIHGPGGMGKTVLMWWTADECARQNLPCAYIDLAQFPFTDSVDVMAEIAAQLGDLPSMEPFAKLLAGYRARFQSRFLALQTHNRLPATDLQAARADVMAAFMHAFGQLKPGQKVVILLDNLETIHRRSDRERLETELLIQLARAAGARLVFASRAQMQWRAPMLSDMYRPLHLTPFDDSYARDLSRVVLPRLLERDSFLMALRVSGGHPYSVVRLSRVGSQWFDLPDQQFYQKLIEEVWTNVIIRFMLKGVNPTVQEVLSRTAIVRSFDMSGLRYFSHKAGLMADTIPAAYVDMIDTLNREVSAIRFDEVRKGYRLQPPIRPVCLELHRLASDLQVLNDLALDFYREYMRQMPVGCDEWRRCIIELSYHLAVIAGRTEEAKSVLATALSRLRARQNIEAAIKLRDELGEDWDVTPATWQDVFQYFEDRELAAPVA